MIKSCTFTGFLLCSCCVPAVFQAVRERETRLWIECPASVCKCFIPFNLSVVEQQHVGGGEEVYLSYLCGIFRFINIYEMFYFRLNTHANIRTDEAPKSSSGRCRKRKADVAIVSR